VRPQHSEIGTILYLLSRLLQGPLYEGRLEP
jgi:hypothetical protein